MWILCWRGRKLRFQKLSVWPRICGLAALIMACVIFLAVTACSSKGEEPIASSSTSTPVPEVITIGPDDRGEFACKAVPDEWSDVLGDMKLVPSGGQVDSRLQVRTSRCTVLGTNGEAQLLALDFKTPARLRSAFDSAASGAFPGFIFPGLPGRATVLWAFRFLTPSLTKAEGERVTTALLVKCCSNLLP